MQAMVGGRAVGLFRRGFPNLSPLMIELGSFEARTRPAQHAQSRWACAQYKVRRQEHASRDRL